MIEISHLDHIALAVKDLEKSVNWYQDILGLEILREKEWGEFPIFMIAQNKSGLALFPNPNGNPVEMPTTRKSGLPHIAFNVDKKNFEAAQEFLKEKRIEFDFQDHSIAHSIYLRDPDDYCIELTTYL